MYIYNITTNIEEVEEQRWLRWMQEVQIPKILRTGMVISIKMCQVLIKEEMGGVTYSVQYTVESEEVLEKYLQEYADRLKKEESKLFGGKLVFFETELKLVYEQFSKIKQQ